MADLEDYSGRFSPDFKLTDLSKEALASQVVEMGKFYLLIAGQWYNLCRDKLGQEMADELHFQFWEELGEKWECYEPRLAVQIWSRDVAAVLKQLQCDGGLLVGEMRCELVNNDPNHGILTMVRCLALEYFERHADIKLLESTCAIDCFSIPRYVKRFHPDLTARCLKIPPRKSKDEIACQWEIFMDPTHSSCVGEGLPEWAKEAQRKADLDYV